MQKRSMLAVFGAITMPIAFWVGLIASFTTSNGRGTDRVFAQEITTSADTEQENKRKILTAFFEKNHSPLIAHVGAFLKTADKYDLDYRLLPAISCTESSCGKFLIKETHNPFGWGIYGAVVTYFKTYEEAIDKVGAGLKTHYIANGLTTPETIEPIYTPPSHGHWRRSVRFFMNQMDSIAANDL